MAEVKLIEGTDDAQIAARLHQRLTAALAASDAPVTLSVPGGSTPFPILAALAQMPLYWRRITVWPGDDRLVPEDHEASNSGRIRALLEPAGAEVVRLSVMEQVPHFDLAWLGMGADGHIASLFPNTDPRVDDPERIRRLTPDPLPPDAPFERVTLTIPALLDSDHLLFVIRGEDKRALFGAAMSGRSDLPVARLLGAARCPVTCFT
jgi:6-phosphogluconolactonase